MNVTRIILATVIAMASSISAHGQQQPAADPAPTPAASAQTPAECTAGAVKRHDHASERGYGAMAVKHCEPAAAATVAKTLKPRKLHEHSTFHKLM